MVSRRPHRKSRLGCLTCKQRRVKCDESGPPCGPCASRSVECRYGQASRTSSQKAASSIGERSNGGDLVATVATPWPQGTRELELRLLHQWTSVTYKSYCGTVEEEYYNWQVFIPKMAMKHDCLLDGLFAMAALEIGAFSEDELSQDYIDAALEYQNRASRKLREEIATTDLSTVPQDKHQALWALSSILMILALAIPPYTLRTEEKYDMIDHMMTFISLLKGFVVIVMNKIKSHKEDPLLCKYKEWDELESKPISPENQAAFDRLRSLNEEIHGAGRAKERFSEKQSMTYHAACRKAVFHLEECFSKCAEPDTRAYGLAWILFSGEDFISAISNREPLALLILMHWGMFLEIQSYGVWYVQKVGAFLVEDLSRGLRLGDNHQMEESIVWVRKQIGLD